MPFLCVECLSKIEHLTDDELHMTIFSLLRNGTTPSTDQHINAFLADVPQNPSAYGEAITEMENLLSSLKNAQSNLQSRIHNARSLISAPIRKLPPEILNEIFNFYCWQNSDPRDGCILTLDDSYILLPTLELSWVCSYWRTSVRCRPDLWSSMRVSHRRLRSSKKEIFDIYIEYSGKNMLDFDYDVNIDDYEFDEIMFILLDNSERWRRATLRIPQYERSFVFRAQAWLTDFVTMLSPGLDSPIVQRKEHFPALEYTHIHSNYYPIPWPFAFLEFLETFSPCSQLRTLSMCDFSWAGHSTDFSNITNLSLESFSGRSFGHLLCRLPMLETLKVNRFHLSEDIEGDLMLEEKGYHSSTLSKLDVSFHTFREPEAWNFLYLPSLTHLEISTEYSWETEYFIAPFSSMILQSECKLQTLHLHHKGSSKELIGFIDINLPESIMNLTLSFNNRDDVEAFVQIAPLRTREDGSRLFPNLRSLQVNLFWVLVEDEDFGGHGVCLSHIDRLINSRITAGKLSGLQTVTILGLVPREITSKFVSHFDTHFADLRKAGLNIEFRFP